MGQMVFDAWTHEQDVRSALGLACDRDSDALDVSFDWWLSTALLMTPAASGEAPPIRLVTEAGEVTLGVGEPVHTLTTSRFELLRTVTGRRSVAQVQRLDFDGDAPLHELVLAGDFFRPATHDIVE